MNAKQRNAFTLLSGCMLQPIIVYLENMHFPWYLRKQIFFNLSKGKIIKLYNFENPYNLDSTLYSILR